MKTVIMLQPKIGDMDDFRDRPTPPMALIHVSSLICETYNIVFIDQRLDARWDESLIEALKNNPIAVCITTLSGPMIQHALDMAKVVRDHSSAPIVWGGTHVTMLPEQSIANRYVDFLILGEGEYTLKKLLRCIEENMPLETLRGVWGKKRESIFKNDQPDPVDYNRLPMAPYEIVDFNKYLYSYQGYLTLDYLSSRGCPHACSYCYNTKFNKNRWSAKSADKVLEELSRLQKKYCFEMVYFLDDNFFIDFSRAFAIIRGLEKLGLKYQIQGVDIQTIAKLSDKELSDLEQSGLQKVTIGIETTSNRLRKQIGKWGTIEEVTKQLNRLANRNIIVLTSFIIGFPDETWEEIYNTVNYAIRLQTSGKNFRLPQLYNYTPVQGTPMADKLKKNGYVFPENLEDWEKIDWNNNSIFKDYPSKVKILENLSFLSKFIDRKNEDYGSKKFISFLYNLYKPIATFRLRNRFFFGLWEKGFYERIKGFV